MEITYSPSSIPGSCYFCGSGSREYYIDTHLSVEFHGAMYVCNICVEEMARLVRFIPPDEYKGLLQHSEELETEVFSLTKRVTTLEGVLRDLANAGYTVHDDGRIDRSDGAVLEALLEPQPTVPEGKRKLGKGARETSEPSNDQGMGELRSDDSSNATDLFGI